MTRSHLLAVCLFVAMSLGIIGHANATCNGSFVNPITDICWDCMFPLTIGDIEILPSDYQDTADNPASPICLCPRPPPQFVQIGIEVGFWEPVRLADVTHDPWCLVNLGGIQLVAPYETGQTDRQNSTGLSEKHKSSWNVHWYVYPVMYILEVLTDWVCEETGSFDIGYMTEIDPLWLDDQLAFLINPEAVLFDNPIAQAACAADCVAATTYLPLDPLFWCAGCQGSMYPLDGSISEQNSDIQGTQLMAERMAYKLHRELILWGTAGYEALCAKIPEPVIRKSQYRFQIVNPVPNSVGPDACLGIGGTTTLFEPFKMVPVSGENFGYLLWRKRNCCAF